MARTSEGYHDLELTVRKSNEVNRGFFHLCEDLGDKFNTLLYGSIGSLPDAWMILGIGEQRRRDGFSDDLALVINPDDADFILEGAEVV